MSVMRNHNTHTVLGNHGTYPLYFVYLNHLITIIIVPCRDPFGDNIEDKCLSEMRDDKSTFLLDYYSHYIFSPEMDIYQHQSSLLSV